MNTETTYSILVPDHYPQILADWRPKSDFLWFSGDLSLASAPMASVVGSRKLSEEGARRARHITRLLCRNGYCIVSGLAEGVDTLAHETALALNAPTIAVMGTPIEDCYPKQNLNLKRRIQEKGLVLSQFAPNSRVHRSNFPKRNTLMAALSEVTVIVEASETSGTKHQAMAAVKMGRKLGFLASVSRSKISWVDHLIDKHQAFVIATPDDLLAHLSMKTSAGASDSGTSLDPVQFSIPDTLLEDGESKSEDSIPEQKTFSTPLLSPSEKDQELVQIHLAELDKIATRSGRVTWEPELLHAILSNFDSIRGKYEKLGASQEEVIVPSKPKKKTGMVSSVVGCIRKFARSS